MNEVPLRVHAGDERFKAFRRRFSTCLKNQYPAYREKGLETVEHMFRAVFWKNKQGCTVF